MGWDVGVATMKRGEVSRLVIAADYGYGAGGSPPKIPGGATLVGAPGWWWWCVEWVGGAWGMCVRSAPARCSAQDQHGLLSSLPTTATSLQVFEVELISWKSVKDIAGARVCAPGGALGQGAGAGSW